MRERLPIPVVEIICALEREAANTDTDPRWLAARCLRSMDQWETRTLMCRVDTRPSTPETRSEVQAVCDRAAHLADVPTPVCGICRLIPCICVSAPNR